MGSYEGDQNSTCRPQVITECKVLPPGESEVEKSRAVNLHMRKRLGGGVDTQAAASFRGRGCNEWQWCLRYVGSLNAPITGYLERNAYRIYRWFHRSASSWLARWRRFVCFWAEVSIA